MTDDQVLERAGQGLLLHLLPRRPAEAIRLRAGLDDVRLMCEPVDHGLAQPCVGEDLGHSEKGRFVLTMMAAFSARSATTWKRSSAISASET